MASGNVSAIVTAIAALSPIVATSSTSVTVKDATTMHENVETFHTPVMMPAPIFTSDHEIESKSFGAGLNAKLDFMYTLNYRYFYQAVGMNLNTAQVYQELTESAHGIFITIKANDAIGGAVHIQPTSISSFPIVTDPTNQEFWGCDLGFRVLEHLV